MANEYGNNKLFNVLLRINLISKICLSSPFTIERDYTVVKSKKLSWFGFIVSLISFWAEIGMQLYFVPIFNTNPYRLLALIRTSSRMLFHLICIVEAKTKVQQTQQIFEDIKVLENSVQLTFKEEREYSAKANRILFIFLSVIVLLNINTFLRPWSSWCWWVKALLLFHINIQFIIPFTMEIQFATFITLVETYTDWLHNNLKLTFPQSNTLSPTRVFELKRTAISSTETWRIEKLRHFRYLSRAINDLKEHINQAFSFRLCFFILEVFVQLVFVIFLIILKLQLWNTSNSNPDRIIIAWHFTLLTYTFYSFIGIVHYCDSAANKGKRTGTVLHQLQFAASEENIRGEVSHFSLELLHRNPSITAFEFFNIDYSLFSSLLASCTMHIIILLQFKFPVYEGISPIEDLLSRS